eukprot:3733887-Heterocapsa_arctica.AAC.1
MKSVAMCGGWALSRAWPMMSSSARNEFWTLLRLTPSSASPSFLREQLGDELEDAYEVPELARLLSILLPEPGPAAGSSRCSLRLVAQWRPPR